jgi:hypothetical protein
MLANFSLRWLWRPDLYKDQYDWYKLFSVRVPAVVVIGAKSGLPNFSLFAMKISGSKILLTLLYFGCTTAAQQPSYGPSPSDWSLRI